MMGKKLLYLREGKISSEFRMFLRGLFSIGYDAEVVDDISRLMELLREARYRCTVAISGYNQSGVFSISHAIVQQDPSKGRNLRVIVMSYPGDQAEAWKRRNFEEVAATPEELKTLLERPSGLRRVL